jgi:hypothetical protein
LLPEDVVAFDREFRAAMAEATDSLDLGVIGTFVQRWWRIAWSSVDPVGHRTMMNTAHRLNAGEHVSTTPWSVTKTRLGL